MAVVDGAVVSFLLTKVVEWIDGRKRVLWLDYIAVDPKCRRNRIASLLLENAKRYARGNKVDEIFTTLNIDNEPSRKLLVRLGFVVKDWRIASLVL